MIVVEINKKGAKVSGVEKCVEKALKKKYSGIDVRVYRKEIPESRSERFYDVQSLVRDAKSQAEDLRDELQNWLDNSLSQGSKSDELQQAIDELEQFINSCDECGNTDVSFPSMF